MNNRINIIATQAGLQPFEDCGPGYVAKMEKFAELIIKECAELTLDYKGCSYYEGWMDYRDEIKEHFGVK